MEDNLAPYSVGSVTGTGHFPLLSTSPAIDNGNDEVCSADPVLSTDQLGQSRVGTCDIGAIQFEDL
jgi:hypothetical protein